ncbi:nSTAND3 domain-containing NTPase [Bradyrhizobium sp. LM2.3]
MKPMSIAITAPQKFDFQDLVCIELMLRFEANPGLTLLVEGDEDAEMALPRSALAPLTVEVQVKGASGPVAMAKIVDCLAHCPDRQVSGCLFERILGSPDRIALLVMSGRCDDAASAFVLPFNWDGTAPPVGRIKTATAAAFLQEFGSLPASSDSDLMTRRKAHRDALVSKLTTDAVRQVLDRVIVFERIGDGDLRIACEQHLKKQFRIPQDRIVDIVNRLHKRIKDAKSDGTDAVPAMRAVLAEASPASLRPQGYVSRGVESELIATLTDRNCLLLSGPPRCGKSAAARWVAAEFEQLGYDVQQGSDLETANRFLLEPGNAQRLFVLDDPLGGAHLDPEAGRVFERLATLLSRLSVRRKVIVAQSQDAIFHTLGLTELRACTVSGNAWTDLGQYSPDFLQSLWIQLATRANTPPSLRARMATALANGDNELEPGCLQHLVLSNDLSDDMPLDQAVRLAREPARSLGHALAAQPSMADLLAALAIASTPSAPVDARELAFALDDAATSLPGKVASAFPGLQLGGTPPAEITPTYDKEPALKREAEIDLEKLERRGIVAVTSPRIAFTHPYYRACAEAILDGPSARIAAGIVRMAERALFSLSPLTSRAAARNLDWLFRATASRQDAQHKLISICVDGLHSIYPATRDLCFAFLVRHLTDLSDELKSELPGWVRTIAHTSLDGIRWRDGEAVFPSESIVDGRERFMRYLRQVKQADVSVELKTLESDDASYLCPERATEALAYFKRKPAKLTLRAMGRLLSYDEAVLRAEAAKLWLLRNRSDDRALLSRIFEDENPAVILGAFKGVCLGWSEFSASRQASILNHLIRVAANPFVALLLLDRLVVFNRVEYMGENPPWSVFGALMPIVLAVLPADANFSESRLYAAMGEACERLPVDAVIPILTSWTSWIEREIARGIMPDEYALAVSEILLDVTKTRASLRQDLVKRLLALLGTTAAAGIIRDFIDAWPNLDQSERDRLIDVLTRDRADLRWLQAVVLTRRVVPPELQDLILGNPSALSADASDIIRNTPPSLLDAAVSVYCGRPQPLWWLGTHHTPGTIWKAVTREIALQPAHSKFDTVLADIIYQQDDKRIVSIVESVEPEHLEKLFEMLLHHRLETNGNYLRKAWGAFIWTCQGRDQRRLA